jgi:hypothetical protein
MIVPLRQRCCESYDGDVRILTGPTSRLAC